MTKLTASDVWGVGQPAPLCELCGDYDAQVFMSIAGKDDLQPPAVYLCPHCATYQMVYAYTFQMRNVLRLMQRGMNSDEAERIYLQTLRRSEAGSVWRKRKGK